MTFGYAIATAITFFALSKKWTFIRARSADTLFTISGIAQEMALALYTNPAARIPTVRICTTCPCTTANPIATSIRRATGAVTTDLSGTTVPYPYAALAGVA